MCCSVNRRLQFCIVHSPTCNSCHRRFLSETSIQRYKRCTLYGESIQAIWISRNMTLCYVIKR
jgi:hypothetical protein